jgi:4-amino-4-deoxy-L-arabinose transferase-like glycosyltransferase
LTTQTYKPALFWALIIFSAILLFFRIGATPVYILDEVKNAECAREMLQRNDWVTPTFNGGLRPDKPPLHYFFMMASYKMFGVTEFAARFFSAIMGLLTLVVTFLYTKKFLAPFVAFCAVIILVSSTHFLFEFRLAVPDPYLIFFITLGLFSAFTWVQQDNTGQLFISAAAFALATLAKGPVALLLPGTCILMWIILKKKWTILLTWKLPVAIVLFCAIALPWYIAVHKATNGLWTREFFIDNNLKRFSDTQEGHGGIFILTPAFVLIGLLPFMSFIGEVFKQRKYVFQNELTKFSGIVVLVFVVFFSISSTKLPNYPMPCYAFAAVILGSFISALLDGKIVSKKYPVYIVVIFSIALAIAGYFAIGGEAELKSLQWLALLLLIAPVIMLVIMLNKKRGWKGYLVALITAYAILNITVLDVIYPALYNQNPVAKTINLVKQSSHILAYNLYNPGFRFYVDKDIATGDTAALHMLLNNYKDAIIITRARYSDSLKGLPVLEVARHKDIFELPTTVIYKRKEGM